MGPVAQRKAGAPALWPQEAVLKHRQPRPPSHSLGGPRPCSPSCSSRSACAAPPSGSLDGPPTCWGGQVQSTDCTARTQLQLAVDTQGAEKIVTAVEHRLMEQSLECEIWIQGCLIKEPLTGRMVGVKE